MSEQKFFVCRHCGNLVGMIHNSGVRIICCGEKMELLNASTFDASSEKHVPVVTVNGDKVRVQVGSVIHPMTEEHHIDWVYIQTEKGGIRHAFNHTDEPVWEFCIHNDKPVAAFEYCNLHGLWKTEIN